MKLKKIAALLLAVLMVVAMASCGKSASKEVKVIDIKLTDEDYAFGVKKDDPELLEKVNAYVKQIKEDGTLGKICDKYFGDGKPEGIDAVKVDSSKDQLVVATNAAFEPFEYKQGDKFYGIDMEVAAGLAKYLNKELVIVDMSFDAVCLSVSQGKADIAMAGLTIKPEREEFVTFSDSYYAASQKVVTLTSDTTFDSCKTADDVVAVIKGMENGTKAGCQNGTTGQLYLEGDEEMEFEGFANITTSGYDSGSLAIQNVINGNLKFVVIDEAPANAIVKALNAVNK